MAANPVITAKLLTARDLATTDTEHLTNAYAGLDFSIRYCTHLGDVQSVENQDMVVVLGQSDYIAFRSDLEPTAAAHFDIGALELPDQRTISLEYSHMEAVTMAVPNENIASVADVDSIGVVGDVFTANATHEVAFLIEDHYAVTLKINNTCMNIKNYKTVAVEQNLSTIPICVNGEPTAYTLKLAIF